MARWYYPVRVRLAFKITRKSSYGLTAQRQGHPNAETFALFMVATYEKGGSCNYKVLALTMYKPGANQCPQNLVRWAEVGGPSFVQAGYDCLHLLKMVTCLFPPTTARLRIPGLGHSLWGIAFLLCIQHSSFYAFLGVLSPQDSAVAGEKVSRKG